jgi:16S rRNA (uracil1498-N3)-methyltransferase
MTRRRWIADEHSEDHAALTGEHAAHLVRVLRAHIGEEFDIATGSQLRRGRVVKISEQRVEFELGEELATTATPQITLLLAIFKFDRMEWAIEKITELGVSRIVPVIAGRTDAHLASAAHKRVQRWERIARQAAEQSRRSMAPEMVRPGKLTEALDQVTPLRLVLSETERERSLKDALRSQRTIADVSLAIGPEGGWTSDELGRFTGAGWISASLGNTVLRAETAAIAATAIVMSHLA